MMKLAVSSYDMVHGSGRVTVSLYDHHDPIVPRSAIITDDRPNESTESLTTQFSALMNIIMIAVRIVVNHRVLVAASRPSSTYQQESHDTV